MNLKIYMFIKILIIALLHAAVCYSEGFKLVEDVEVIGNDFITKRTILRQVETKKGGYYFESTVRSDIRRIIDLGYFEDVTVEVMDVPAKDGEHPSIIVRFLVSEKPKIERVVFVGNKKISNTALRGEIQSRAGENIDRTDVFLDERKIAAKYKEKGYADVKVEHFVNESEKRKNSVILTFYITEGNRILIKEVNINGIDSFRLRRIRRLMKTRPKRVFNDETLEEDLDKIADFYKNRGFLNVAITKPVITYNEERTDIFVSFEIEEGRKYRLDGFSFEGNSVYSDRELAKAVVMKLNRIFNEDALRESVAGIQELYANKGYLRAQMDARKLTNDHLGTVNIVFSITENEVVYVDRIFVDGNISTKEKVIKREITIKEGDPFSAAKVRRSMEKIMNLGFMDDVHIDIQQPAAIDRADLVFEVLEGKPGVLSAGVGFSNVDKVLGNLSVSHSNLFGRAQRLNLMWEFGERKQSYSVSFTEPWFMDKPVSAGINVFDTTRRRQYGSDTSAYKERRTGGGLDIGPRFSDIYSAFFSYNYENIKIFDVDRNLADVISGSQDVTSSLTPTIIRDTRDSVFDPTRGSRNSASVQLAGGIFGGDVNFYKPMARSSWFFPTFWKFVLSLNADMRYVNNFSPSKEVPIYERFYVGGADTIRGYDYRGEIGPFEGGKVMAVYNAEYGFPIVQERRRTILQGAFFIDVGNAWADRSDFSLKIGRKENMMKAGVGFGIRFKTPVFPIRLDWGYGLHHKPGEDLSQFYFTIGNVF